MKAKGLHLYLIYIKYMGVGGGVEGLGRALLCTSSTVPISMITVVVNYYYVPLLVFVIIMLLTTDGAVRFLFACLCVFVFVFVCVCVRANVPACFNNVLRYKLNIFCVEIVKRLEPNFLSMQDQISSVCRASFLELRRLASIRPYLPESTSARLVAALITSRLGYCNSVLAALPAEQIGRLQRVQNRAARLVLKKTKARSYNAAAE